MRLKDGEKIIVTHPAIRHQRKHIVQGTLLIVGKDIPAKEAQALVGMKRATTNLDWKPPGQSSRLNRSGKESA
jgi:hypothetical protein